MTNFKNHYNSKPQNDEVFTLPSETVPDQSMTVQEILRRFASGLSTGGQRVPMYESEDDLLGGINPKTLDLSELQDIKIAVKEEIQEITKRKFDMDTYKARQKLRKELEEEIKITPNIEDVENTK